MIHTHLPRDLKYYIASPYSKHKPSLDRTLAHEFAYLEALNALKWYTALGFVCWSPIVEGHALTQAGLAEAGNAQFWLQWCKKRAPLFDAILVCSHMDGWQDSAGVAEERTWFDRWFFTDGQNWREKQAGEKGPAF